MPSTPPNRRSFIAQSIAGITTAAATAQAAGAPKIHLSTNQYSWYVFYPREGRDFFKEMDACFGEIASCGIQGFEGSASSVDDVKRYAPLLKKHGLDMRSLYVNSILHEQDKAQESIQQAIAIAEEAHKLGTKIIVTNPSPIQWGSDEAKTDPQLVVQARALNQLGKELKQRGMTLAYHNHAPEMKHSAREFHHMMLGTDPNNVTFCLDAHWVFRGADNSMLALLDIVELYGERITEMHLRQSHDGIWAETFCPGDLSYEKLVQALLKKDVKIQLVLEVAVEEGTPHTMKTVEAHKKSAAYAREVLAPLAENGKLL